MNNKKWEKPKVTEVKIKKQYVSLGDCGKVTSSETGGLDNTCDPRWLAS